MQLLVPYDIKEATLVSSNVLENEYPTLVSGTVYPLGQRVISGHKVYETVITPQTSWDMANSEQWLEVGATNRWAAFDESLGTATTATSSIVFNLDFSSSVRDVGLMGLVGSSVTVTSAGGTFTQSIPQSGANVVFYAVGHTTGSLTITISGTGIVSVSNISVGIFIGIGDVEYGTTLGGIDYSTRTFDKFGNDTISVRGHSDEFSPAFIINTSDVDVIERVLTAIRSTPVMIVGLAGLESTILLGYFMDWKIRVSNYSKSRVTGKVESLVQGSI